MGNVCPECKGSGEYRGLNTVEPCRACGGKKRQEIPPLNLTASTRGFEAALAKAGKVLVDAARKIDAMDESLQPLTLKAKTLCGPFLYSPEMVKDWEACRKVREEAFRVLREHNSGGQSIRHEIEEQITEKPFDEICPAELEGIAEGRLVKVGMECENINRAFEVLDRIIDRPLFGLPYRAFQLVDIGFDELGKPTGTLKLVSLYGDAQKRLNAPYVCDPCRDMLFIPILED